jgi:hypothetical protein
MVATLLDIRNKVRRITGRPSTAQISNAEIDANINTFYIYDFPEHLRLQNLRVNYQFLTKANIPVYDFPVELYLDVMPPVYVAGFKAVMSQSRDKFYRLNSNTQRIENVATGTGIAGPYTFTLSATPIIRGYKRNPPGAFNTTVVTEAADINYAVVITAFSAGVSVSLVDDGQGNLRYITDDTAQPIRGTINYLTGAVVATFSGAIDANTDITAQYIAYVAGKPTSLLFFQDQITCFPIPDKAYTISFEAYQYPTAFLIGDDSATPQLKEWWQLLAYGAADKIFSDNADMDNMAKFRPLLDEQMRLCQRRSLVQQANERTSTIFADNQPFNGGWGGNFGQF